MKIHFFRLSKVSVTQKRLRNTTVGDILGVHLNGVFLCGPLIGHQLCIITPKSMYRIINGLTHGVQYVTTAGQNT